MRAERVSCAGEGVTRFDVRRHVDLTVALGAVRDHIRQPEGDSMDIVVGGVRACADEKIVGSHVRRVIEVQGWN